MCWRRSKHSFLAGPMVRHDTNLPKVPSRLFTLAQDKNAFLCSVGEYVNGVWTWDLNLCRRLFDWEIDQYRQLVGLLNLIVPRVGPDSIIWTGDTNGKFSVKGFCAAVEERIFGEKSWLVPKRVRKLVPPKVVLFTWQLMESKIAVKHSLIRRGILIENGGLCEICGLEGESENHLMIHCHKIWGLWSAILAREEVLFCIPLSTQALLAEWPSLRAKSDPILWETIPYALFWSIWLARNDLVFN